MKKLIWPAAIMLGIALLLGGLAGFLRSMFTNQLEAEIAALKAKGKPLTIQELVGPPIPDDENAAVPFTAFQTECENKTYEPQWKVMDAFPSTPGNMVADDTWKMAERALVRMKPLRDLVEEALSRPKCRFEPNSTNPVELQFPHLATLRRAASMYGVSALVNARNGRMDQAVDDICTQIGIARAIVDEPYMIAHLVKQVIMRRAAEIAVASTDLGSFNEEQARRMFDAFGRFDMVRSNRRAWDGERVMYVYLANPDNVRKLGGLMAALGGPTGTSVLGKPLVSTYEQTLMRGEVATFLRSVNMQDEYADLSYPKARARGLTEFNRNQPVYAVLTRNVLPEMATLRLRRYVADAEISRVRIFLALQAYKARFGGYPSSLQDVRDKLGWNLPMDPFSEKDFVYKPQGSGFILYSVGPDMKDDGGGRPCAKSYSGIQEGDIILIRNK